MGTGKVRRTTMETKNLERVVIRFAGDSGDGMQLTGTEFAKAAAEAGNDISTFPDFPAEIRAPAGSLFGVSGFQLHFSSSEIYTPGDAPDVLVVMNPAALKTNLSDLIDGGTLIVNTGAFVEANLKKAGYTSNPLDGRQPVDKWKVHAVDIAQLTTVGSRRDGPVEQGEGPVEELLRARPGVLDVRPRDRAPRSGASTSSSRRSPASARRTSRCSRPAITTARPPRCSRPSTRCRPRRSRPACTATSRATRRWRSGSSSATELAGKKLFYAGYPITPASSILHTLAKYKNFGTLTFQAEDEIAGDRRGDRRGVRRRGRGDRVERPGHRAQGRGDRPGRDDRAAARDRQRPARRAVDRPADEDRAVRPRPGAVRPQRRGPDAR